MDIFGDANKTNAIRGKQQQLFLLLVMAFMHITSCVFSVFPFSFPCLPNFWKAGLLLAAKVVVNILSPTWICIHPLLFSP